MQSNNNAVSDAQPARDPKLTSLDDDEDDSSLTAAANKSLDLSRSLGDACAHELSLELSGEKRHGAREAAGSGSDDDSGRDHARKVSVASASANVHLPVYRKLMALTTVATHTSTYDVVAMSIISYIVHVSYLQATAGEHGDDVQQSAFKRPASPTSKLAPHERNAQEGSCNPPMCRPV